MVSEEQLNAMGFWYVWQLDLFPQIQEGIRIKDITAKGYYDVATEDHLCYRHPHDEAIMSVHWQCDVRASPGSLIMSKGIIHIETGVYYPPGTPLPARLVARRPGSGQSGRHSSSTQQILSPAPSAQPASTTSRKSQPSAPTSFAAASQVRHGGTRTPSNGTGQDNRRSNMSVSRSKQSVFASRKVPGTTRKVPITPRWYDWRSWIASS